MTAEKEKVFTMEDDFATIATKVKTVPKSKPSQAHQPEAKQASPKKGETNTATDSGQSSFKPITAEEQALAARVAADSTREWETIKEDSSLDYSLGKDRFELPEPALKAQQEKRFAFRWIEMRAARVDSIRSLPVPEKWWICNSTNTPFLAGFLDPVLGCITREGQLLVFKPWWMHEKHKAMTAERTYDRSRDLTRKNRSRVGDAGLEFQATARALGEGSPSRNEIGGNDDVFFDEGAKEGAVDLSDLTTE